jgi:hypothetical protein
LLAEIGGRDDKNAPLPLSPLLGKHDTCLNSLPETDLIRENRAFRKRRLERKQRGLDLMRVKIDLGIQ